jgi:hypothetical protein
MHRTMILVLSGLLLAGCGGGKSVISLKHSNSVPDFYLNPPKQRGAIFGTGMAKQKSIQLAKETADLRACQDIVSALSLKVNMIIKDYLSQSGIGSKTEVKELARSVTRALSDIELKGVSIEKREFTNGKTYSLAKYPLNGFMKKLVNEAVNKSLLSNEELFIQFREKQGFEELDRQLEKMMALE